MPRAVRTTVGVGVVKDYSADMGRIVTSVIVGNANDPAKSIRIDALVDTGASHLVLPTAWKERLGVLVGTRTVEMETATQEPLAGEVCGPVSIQVEGFPVVFGEVLFVEMHPRDGIFEPLLGYIPLEQSQAVVDMLGHRLIHVKRMDLK